MDAEGGRGALVHASSFEHRADAPDGLGDAQRGIGAGLSEVEAGLRLRYELRREFAPYIGIERAHRFGNTAGYARAAGAPVAETHWIAGIRFWF